MKEKTNNKDIELIKRFDPSWIKGEICVKRIGGQTNRNYLVVINDQKFFVRLPWERKDIVDRNIESKNISALHSNKCAREITPKVLMYVYGKKNVLNAHSKKIIDLPDGAMMAEYIDGKVFTKRLLNNKAYVTKLIKSFYKFHSSGVKFYNSYNVFKDEIKKYRIAAIKHDIQKVIQKEVINDLEEAEKRAEKAIKSSPGQSTHNDFILQNFLAGNNGKLYLLDFEYAGFNLKGGFLYDFAFLFADNMFRKPPFKQKEFERLLSVADTIYKKRLDRQQIYWLSIAAILVMFWWGLLRYFSVKTQKEKDYFKQYVLSRSVGIKDVLMILDRIK